MFSYFFIKADLMAFNMFFNSSLETTPIYSNLHPLPLSILIRNIHVRDVFVKATLFLKRLSFTSKYPIVIFFGYYLSFRKKYFTSFF